MFLQNLLFQESFNRVRINLIKPFATFTRQFFESVSSLPGGGAACKLDGILNRR